jgi:predicted nucleic acid-binding protein
MPRNADRPPLLLAPDVWVASLDRDDPRHHTARRLLARLTVDGHPLLAAPFLITDIACRTAVRLGPDVAREVEGLLTTHPGLRLHPMAEALFARATALGIARRLDTHIALLAALAEAGAATVVSWDPTTVDRLRAATPEQLLDADIAAPAASAARRAIGADTLPAT